MLLIFIVGPTASGKTEFALKAAQIGETKLGGPCEIISCDSIQVFADIELGTAKPSAQQLSQVPHHLLSFVPLKQAYTAGEYRRDALKVIADGARRGVRAFFIVGGSGFYVQALQKGMFEIPAANLEVREKLLRQLKDQGLAALYAELTQKDPEYAKKIAAQDSYRILRGLEVWASLGRSMTQIQQEFAQKENPNDLSRNHQILKLGLGVERSELRQRVVNRTQQMLQSGWIQEVGRLQSLGLGACAAMQSVGYREIQNWLLENPGGSEVGTSELSHAIVTSTMQLAKRQSTWFRRDTETHWLESESRWEKGLKSFNLLLADLT
jgi:tRNA dimethylallyltransferase